MQRVLELTCLLDVMQVKLNFDFTELINKLPANDQVKAKNLEFQFVLSSGLKNGLFC